MAIKVTIGLLLFGVLSALSLLVIDGVWGDAVAQWSSIGIALIFSMATMIATIAIVLAKSN